MTIYLPPSLKHCDTSWPIPSHTAGSCAIIFDIIYALKPKLCVCVNTLEESLYTTAAQALFKSDSDGVVFAATNWLSDEKFLTIQQFSRNHYPSISYMMREAPKACLRHYSEQSIDCLVIQVNNLNNSEVKELIEAWKNKLAANGMIIVRHETTQSIDSSPLSINTTICFDNECVSLINNNSTHEDLQTIISLLHTPQGQAFYRHISHFIDNKNQLNRAEKTKLINQIKKQISNAEEKHG